MARRARRGPRPSGRVLEWHTGVRAFSTTQLAGVITNVTLLPTATLLETVTVMRIVGHVSVVPDVIDVANWGVGGGTIDTSIEMGVQVVNRVAGGVGAARNPAVPDDREGKEWMWRRAYRRAYRLTDGTDEPPDWLLTLHEIGADKTQVDITVKRRVDLSQDEIILSHVQTNRTAGAELASLQFVLLIDLRILLLR